MRASESIYRIPQSSDYPTVEEFLSLCTPVGLLLSLRHTRKKSPIVADRAGVFPWSKPDTQLAHP
jgi:hypothetical protein